MWTDKHQSILEAFEKRFALPPNDESARDWTNKLAQQFKYSFPDEGWGTKQASPTRPPSTDVICTKSPFTGYDVILDQGRPTQSLARYPGPINLVGQVFIEVSPHNYIDLPGPVVPPPPPNPGIDILELMTKLNGIESKLTVIDKKLDALTNNMTLKFESIKDRIEDFRGRNEELHQLTQAAVVSQAQAVIGTLR